MSCHPALRTVLAGLLLLTSAAAQAAGPAATALSVSTDLYMLIAETTMVTADQQPDEHAGRAKDILSRLQTSVPGVLSGLKDRAQADELKAQWEELLTAYEGKPFMVAFRESTYDTSLTARYTAGSGALLMALDEAATREAGATPVKRVQFRALKTLSAYLLLSTGIVGGTAFSANDKDNDIPSGVAAVDKGLAELKQQLAGKPEAATLQRAATRWQFLRPTLLKTSGQSTPYIVYTHGLSVVQTLAQLEGGAR